MGSSGYTGMAPQGGHIGHIQGNGWQTTQRTVVNFGSGQFGNCTVTVSPGTRHTPMPGHPGYSPSMPAARALGSYTVSYAPSQQLFVSGFSSPGAPRVMIMPQGHFPATPMTFYPPYPPLPQPGFSGYAQQNPWQQPYTGGAYFPAASPQPMPMARAAYQPQWQAPAQSYPAPTHPRPTAPAQSYPAPTHPRPAAPAQSYPAPTHSRQAARPAAPAQSHPAPTHARPAASAASSAPPATARANPQTVPQSQAGRSLKQRSVANINQAGPTLSGKGAPAAQVSRPTAAPRSAPAPQPAAAPESATDPKPATATRPVENGAARQQPSGPVADAPEQGGIYDRLHGPARPAPQKIESGYSLVGSPDSESESEPLYESLSVQGQKEQSEVSAAKASKASRARRFKTFVKSLASRVVSRARRSTPVSTIQQRPLPPVPDKEADKLPGESSNKMADEVLYENTGDIRASLSEQPSPAFQQAVDKNKTMIMSHLNIHKSHQKVLTHFTTLVQKAENAQSRGDSASAGEHLGDAANLIKTLKQYRNTTGARLQEMSNIEQEIVLAMESDTDVAGDWFDDFQRAQTLDQHCLQSVERFFARIKGKIRDGRQINPSPAEMTVAIRRLANDLTNDRKL